MDLVAVIGVFKTFARKMYKEHAFITISPRSKGTWTVGASVGNKSKEFTGLTTDTEVDEAVESAWGWIAINQKV